MNKRKLVTNKESMKVNVKCSFLKEEGIKNIEKKYNAKYVLETCLRAKGGGWANFPAAVFYTKEAHPRGSNYFAIYMEWDNESKSKAVPMITDALPSIKDVIFEGLEAEGEVVYSRYRHDMRDVKNGAFVDGGRDYFRFGGDHLNDYNRVKFKVVEDHLEFIDGEK